MPDDPLDDPLDDAPDASADDPQTAAAIAAIFQANGAAPDASADDPQTAAAIAAIFQANGAAAAAPAAPAAPPTPTDADAMTQIFQKNGAAPPSTAPRGIVDTVTHMGPTDWAALASRVGSGVLGSLISGAGDLVAPGAANVAGGAVGSAGEWLAEHLTGQPTDYPALAVAGGTAAIPFGKFFAPVAERLGLTAGWLPRLVNAGAGALRGAGVNTAADVAYRALKGEAPGVDYDPTALLPSAELGALAGGVAGSLHGGVTEAGATDAGSPAASVTSSAGPTDTSPTVPSGPAPGLVPLGRGSTQGPGGDVRIPGSVNAPYPAEPLAAAAETPPPMAPLPMTAAATPDVPTARDYAVSPADTLSNLWTEPFPVVPKTPWAEAPSAGPDYGAVTAQPGTLPFEASEPPVAPGPPGREPAPPAPSDVVSQWLAGQGDTGAPPAAAAAAPVDQPPPPGPDLPPAVAAAVGAPVAPAGPSPVETLPPAPAGAPAGGTDLAGAMPADVLRNFLAGGDAEVLDADTGPNASGDSAASLEALHRAQSMAASGRQFGVYDHNGQFRPLPPGVDAVDYRAQPGETYGVQGPDGFSVFDDNGGHVPPEALAPAPVVPGMSTEADQLPPLAATASGVNEQGPPVEPVPVTPADVAQNFLTPGPGGRYPMQPLERASLAHLLEELEAVGYHRDLTPEEIGTAFGGDTGEEAANARSLAGQPLLGVSPGAPVFHDIMQGRAGTRQSAMAAIQRVLGGGRETSLTDRARQIARIRAGLEPAGDLALSAPSLPPLPHEMTAADLDAEARATEATAERARQVYARALEPGSTDFPFGENAPFHPPFAQPGHGHVWTSPNFDPAFGGTTTFVPPPAVATGVPEEHLAAVLGPDIARDVTASPVWRARQGGKAFVRAADFSRYTGGGKPTYTPKDLAGYRFLYNGPRQAMRALDALATAPPSATGEGSALDVHATPIDTLVTGERQPRLPGDVGAVRDTEATWPPLVDTPPPAFELSGEDHTEGARATEGDLFGHESGSIDPDVARTLAYYGAGAGAGALAGPTLEPDNPLLGTAGGAMLGLGLVAGMRNPAALAKLRALNLFSGAAVPKKLLSDAGVLASTALERPELAGALARHLFTPETGQQVVQGFRAGHGFDAAPGAGGVREPFTSLLSGITQGTQSVLRRAGVEDPAASTFTSTPRSDYGAKAAALAGTKIGNILEPVMRVPINALERGLERTPGVGLLPGVQAMRAGVPGASTARLQALGGLAVLAGVAGHELTRPGAPLEDAPPWAKTLAPFAAGGYMVPAELGTLLDQAAHSGVMPALEQAFTELKGDAGLPGDLSLPELLAEWAPGAGMSRYATPVPPSAYDTRGMLFGPAAARLPFGLNELFQLPVTPTSRLRATPMGR